MRNGEVWLVNFFPSVGDEIRKTRPAIIVNDDEMGGLNLSVVVPITDAKRPTQPWQVKIKPSPSNRLSKESLVDCFQIKSVSNERFTKKIGFLSAKEMDEVKACIAKVLDLL